MLRLSTFGSAARPQDRSQAKLTRIIRSEGARCQRVRASERRGRSAMAPTRRVRTPPCRTWTSCAIVAPILVEGRARRNAVTKLPRLSLARAAMLAAAVVVGYFIFTAVGDALLSQRLDRDEEQLQQEIVDLQRQQAELEAIRDYLQTDEYIEGVARRVLGLVRPGETLVIVSSNAEPTPSPEAELGEDEYRTWWEKLYGP